jgi:hypothetical protein
MFVNQKICMYRYPRKYTEMRLVCCTPAARGWQAVWWRQLKNSLNGIVEVAKFENKFCLVAGLYVILEGSHCNTL